MKKQYHNASLVAGQSRVTNTPTPLTIKSIKPFSPYPSPGLPPVFLSFMEHLMSLQCVWLCPSRTQNL